jgi:hypothetical protein
LWQWLTRFGIALRICSTSSVGSSSFDHHEPLPQPERLREIASTDNDLKEKQEAKVLFMVS